MYQNRMFIGILKCFLCLGILKFRKLSSLDLEPTEYLLFDLLWNYDVYTRPMHKMNESVNVTVSFSLVSIKEYDETDGTLTFIAVLGLEWYDLRMVWDPNLYEGILYIDIGYDKVWVPDVYCVNSVTGFEPVGTAKERVTYWTDGYAVYDPGALFTVSCPGNMEKYPYDSQTCHISFNVWNYRIGEVSLIPSSCVIDIASVNNNNMWTVVGTRVGKILNTGGPQLDFFIEIKRKSRFVTVNVVPLFFLSCLNNLVFLLVPESGERISLCISVLLSISVYLTILNQSLPQNSEPVPIISYKVIADLTVSYLIMIAVILNMKLRNKPSEERVPPYIKSLHNLLKSTCKKGRGFASNSQDNGKITSDTDENEMRTDEEKMAKEQLADEALEDDLPDDDITWKDISDSVDIFCFIVFSFFTLCNFYVFIRLTYLV